MDQKIKDTFHAGILNEFADKLGISIENIREIGGFQNFVYEFQIEGHDYILRITHSSHRTESLITGELSFVTHLAESGVSAARPCCFQNGSLTETVRIGEYYFTGAVFSKAKGQAPYLPESEPAVWETFGELTGRLHRAGKNFEMPHGAERMIWHKNSYIRDFHKYVPKEDRLVHKRFNDLVAEIQKLPQTKASFGLLHGDISPGNFLMDSEGGITLFDFDECEYGYFVSDIAIQLFYSIAVEPANRTSTEFTEEFLRSFIKGYERENSFQHDWLGQLPLFLKLREFILFLAIKRSFSDLEMDDWCRSFMSGRKERLEQGVPFIDFDFAKLL